MSEDDRAPARAMQSGPPATGEGSDASQERLGPLLVRRHRKADGRALILYERLDRES